MKAFKLISLFLLVLAQVALASDNNINVKEHPLSRNGYALQLVSYQDMGATLAAPYPDVLLIHGATYSSKQFDLNFQDYSLARYLARAGFRVWLLDITGYGASEKPKDGFMVDGDYAAEDIAAAVNYITESQKVDKINLLGWSWGTITSARFAVAHPDQLARLVLLAPIISGLEFEPPCEDYHPFTVAGAKADFVGTSASYELIAAYVSETQRHDGAGSPNGSRRELAQARSIQLLPYQELSTPTLFVAGDLDSYLYAEKDLELLMADAPENSCNMLIMGGGHGLFLETKVYRGFQKAITSFFKHGCPPN